MSPQELEKAAKSLHGDGQSGSHDNGQWYSDEDNSFEGIREMTKTEALTELRKSKGKSPVHRGKSPKDTGKSQSTTLSKRPRLTRRGSFFDDSDDSETRETQNSLKRNKARREVASSDSENGDTANDSRSKKLKKSRRLDLSSSESEGEETPLLNIQLESEEMPSNVDSVRKRLRQFQDSSDDGDSSGDDKSSSSKPLTKAAKLADSGSESDDNGLVMDLEPREINSPPADTVDLSTHLAMEECYNDDCSSDQPGSMGTLAVSQSVVS